MVRRVGRGGARGGVRRITDGAAGRKVGGTSKIAIHSHLANNDSKGLRDRKSVV